MLCFLNHDCTTTVTATVPRLYRDYTATAGLADGGKPPLGKIQLELSPYCTVRCLLDWIFNGREKAPARCRRDPPSPSPDFNVEVDVRRRRSARRSLGRKLPAQSSTLKWGGGGRGGACHLHAPETDRRLFTKALRSTTEQVPPIDAWRDARPPRSSDGVR